MLSEPPTGTPAEALGSVPSAAVKKEIRQISFSSSFCEDATADVVSRSVCGVFFTVHKPGPADIWVYPQTLTLVIVHKYDLAHL